MSKYGYCESEREKLEDTFSAAKFKEIQRISETPKFEELLIGARDQFIKEATYDEMEKETIDLMGLDE